MIQKGLTFALILACTATAQVDSIITPTFHAELSVVTMPDSLDFVRADTTLLQFNWAVQFRVFKNGLDAPDIFNLGIKYSAIPGSGGFRSSVMSSCEWSLERRSPEGTFYRIGDMNFSSTDSSFIMSAEVNPVFLEGLDSVQLFGVTDCAPEGRFRLRDTTDFGPEDELIWDKVGDISDRRFDIRFLKGELVR